MTDLVVREYGTGREQVIVLHGGPAAAGDVAPLAEALGKRWHAFEPFQRTSGSSPLTVSRHVQDLDNLIRERCSGGQPVLAGHSWGAMLALAYAAEQPKAPAALVLVGCGTFSERARAEFEARLAARLTPAQRAKIADIRQSEADADRRLAAMGRMMTQVYGHDVEEVAESAVLVDARAHEETWADMIRLQREGVYPSALAAIDVPVLMLHGAADPHPGRLICEDLRTYIPHLQYHEMPECGHSPWLERRAREPFLEMLNTWLAKIFSEPSIRQA